MFLRYSYSSGLILPLLASDTPVLPSGADAFPAGLALRRRGRCPSPLYLTLFRKSARQEKGGTFPLAVCENKRAEIDGVLMKKGNIFRAVQLRLQLGKCNATLFRVDSHYRKGGTHTYNMIKTGNYLKSVMRSNIDARIC